MKSSSDIATLQILASLPKHMLRMHGQENISEFVLHELACKNCFNFSKAAYFVDNPAFNCLKGIAGYAQDEACELSVSIWHNPDAFSQHMRTAPFNMKVRSCMQHSCKNCEIADEEVLGELAHKLDMNPFNYYTWDMKHDNHGYLLYQPCGDHPDQDHLSNGLSLLGFCPIF